MPVKVVMPQMGESITEGTIVKWLKEVGEAVAKDEPLLEISTDKVDAEVPSPAAGTLSKVLHGPNDVVAVETVIGEIALAGEKAGDEPVAAATKPAEQGAAAPAPQESSSPPSSPPARAEAAPTVEEQRPAPGDDEADALRRRSSPLVRRIATEHAVDLAQVQGTGVQGRVTKDDILGFIEAREQQSAPVPAAQQPAPSPAPPRPEPARTASTPASSAPISAATLAPSGPFTGDEQREPLSHMRQRIAEHMVASRRTSPHVHTVFEVDMSRVVAMRERHKASFQSQHGLKLTYTPFFAAAAIDALGAFPVVNASLDGSEIVFHRHVNLGIAVALSHGLIVPVVRHAEELSMIGLQRAITDLADRARTKQLVPTDVGGSTFSITNPGPYGGLYGLPIINQPNVAILSTGNIHRRPLVVTDDEGREAIAIRDVAFLALSFDHRLVDGATADMFMAHLKGVLEAGTFELS